jgi:hypothetical protein
VFRLLVHEPGKDPLVLEKLEPLEVNRMEMNLVLASWLNWEAGELLPEDETRRVFADRGDACFLQEQIPQSCKKIPQGGGGEFLPVPAPHQGFPHPVARAIE